MSLLMTDIEVRLPDRKRASNSFSMRKPVAEVSCIVEGGRCREIVVPVRVGRILMNEGIPLPLEENEAFDRIHELEAQVCFTMLTEMLSRRDHGTQEAHEKLRAYGFRDEEISQALARATDMRFLNDDRFAGYFIEERKRRGWGRRKIELELKKRGIVVDDIPGYPEAFFSDEDDASRAWAIVEKKPVPATRPFDKLVRHLMSKGFSYAIAAEAVKRRLQESDG